MTTLRKAALAAGLALLAMMIIAPVGILMALPDDDHALAATAVFAVCALDVVVGVGLWFVLAPAGRELATAAAALRIVYAIWFACAGTHLLAPADEDRFQSTWDAALLLFGAHLLVVSSAAWPRGGRAGAYPRWIGVLVLVAGLAYTADAVFAVTSGPAFSFAEFAFVGEVVLTVWLLGWGGRARLTTPGRTPASAPPEPRAGGLSAR